MCSFLQRTDFARPAKSFIETFVGFIDVGTLPQPQTTSSTDYGVTQTSDFLTESWNFSHFKIAHLFSRLINSYYLIS